jgi:ribosomal protein L11 methylase PrmA
LELLAGEERGSVLDIGCGSGVLSIAAAKLGFEPVLAFDFDPQAVEAKERNAADNGVSIAVRQSDLRNDDLPDADLALANIAADAVLALSPRLRTGRAITSGYLVSDDRTSTATGSSGESGTVMTATCTQARSAMDARSCPSCRVPPGSS